MAGIKSFGPKFRKRGVKRYDGGGAVDGGYGMATAEADAGKEGANGLGANPGSNGSMGIGQGLGGFIDTIGGMFANPTSGGNVDVGASGNDELRSFLEKLLSEKDKDTGPTAEEKAAAEAALAAQKAKIAKSYANPMQHIAGMGTGYQGELNSYRPNYYNYGRAPVMQFGAGFQQPGRTGGMDNALRTSFQDVMGGPPDAEAAAQMRNQMLSGRGPSAFHRDMMAGPPPGMNSPPPTPPGGGGSTGQPPQPTQPAAPDYGAMVSSAYQDLLGRAPDEAGAQYWTNQLQTGAVKPEDFQNSFRSGGYEDEVFGAYKNILGRDPDAEGRNYWLQQLQSGAVRPEDFESSFRSGIQQQMRAGGLAALSPYAHYAAKLKAR